jgi:hypothetical protein
MPTTVAARYRADAEQFGAGRLDCLPTGRGGSSERAALGGVRRGKGVAGALQGLDLRFAQAAAGAATSVSGAPAQRYADLPAELPRATRRARVTRTSTPSATVRERDDWHSDGSRSAARRKRNQDSTQ